MENIMNDAVNLSCLTFGLRYIILKHKSFLFLKNLGRKVSDPKGKSFFSSGNFMFQGLEHKFQALVHMFQGLEHKFQGLEHKKVLEGKTFSPRGNKKSLRREKKSAIWGKTNSRARFDSSPAATFYFIPALL
jgi:hypothetical protein